MPLGRIVEETSTHNSLTEELTAEWRNPKDAPDAPVIITASDPLRPQPYPQHIYVVWNTWANLSQQDRSRIILRAYSEVGGEAAAQQVTIAMGLTREEAERLRFHYEAIPA